MELESLTTEREYGTNNKFMNKVGKPPSANIGNEFLCPRDLYMTQWERCKVIAYDEFRNAKVRYMDGYETWFHYLSEFRYLDGTRCDALTQANMVRY